MPLEAAGVWFDGFVSSDYNVRDIRWIARMAGHESFQPASGVDPSNIASQRWVRYNVHFNYWEISNDNVVFTPLFEHCANYKTFYGYSAPPVSSPGQGTIYYDLGLNHFYISENGSPYQQVLFSLSTGPIFGLAVAAGLIDWDPNLNPFAFDDFIEPIVSGIYGINASSGGSNGIAKVASIANHPGIVQFTNNAVAAGTAGLVLLDGSPAGVAEGLLSSFARVKFILQSANLPSVNQSIIAGLVNQIQVLSPADGVYFQTIGGTTNWQCICSKGGTATKVDSGVAANNTNWFDLEIVQSATGTFEFFINGNLVATISTNITTSAVEVYCAITTSTITSCTMELDLFRVTYNPISSRHT